MALGFVAQDGNKPTPIVATTEAVDRAMDRDRLR